MSKPLCPAPELGLTAEEVEAQRRRGRQNAAPEPVTKSVGQIWRDNVCTLFNLLNLLIAIALGAVGAWSNMLFILIIALNTLIGAAQELHAKRLVDRLSILSAPSAHVVRGGRVLALPVQELVESDVVELSAGEQVCADAQVLTGSVEVNESLLTGESDPVDKGPGRQLLSGSVIVSGRCRAVLARVGGESYAARLAREARQLRRVNSELLTSMRRVTRFTGFLIPPLGLLLFAEALLWGAAVQSAVVSTAAGLLGMLPKGLVLLISISLAAGTIALSKKQVLVQKLFSLETLAHVDTLCLDKTGTLTRGAMQVERVELTPAGQAAPFARMMGAFLQAAPDSNATFQALQAHFAPNGSLTPRRTVAFSSARKWSAVEFDRFTFVVGAPERLSPGPLPPVLQQAMAEGRRVLLAGIADAPVRADAPLPPVRVLAGIVLCDPLRPNAAQTLEYFQREGVDCRLISGDSPATVSALAAQAGFPHADRCIDMTGITDPAAIEAAARDYAVFGRVSPRQKQQLVQALRRQGRTVAMTGDGVNDLLALREADCSIAVAQGSDAARQIAQIVLLDSDFGALPAVLAEGRRVVNNITRVAGVFFVKTVYSVLLCLICLLANIPFPFVPIQITLIDLVIEGYPAFFTTFVPDGRRVQGRFLPTVLRRAVPNAASFVLCCLPAFLLAPRLGLDAGQLQLALYLLVGTVGIQAVWKSCWPLDRLRAFLCVTMTGGFYLAVLLFRGVLQLPAAQPAALALFAALAALSFALERAVAALLRRLPPRAG